MSRNPFTADPVIAARMGALAGEIGPAITETAEAMLATRDCASNNGAVLLQDEVAQLCAQYSLAGPEELLILLLPAAQKFAAPPISNFFVGAAGLEAQTGNIVLGGNVEFPGTHLGTTLHGEGFVFARAFSRGTSIQTIVIGEAHPCAHCRQFLSEFAATEHLTLVDPLGHRLTMGQLYPWPFDPNYLGQTGAVPDATPWPELRFTNPATGRATERLLKAGGRAYTPYSKCPGAVVLELSDGNLVAGSAIESVSFNPTIGPLQAALIDLLAHGYGYSDIRSATLGTVVGGVVDYSRSVAELLAAVAPDVPLTVHGWTA